MRKKYMRKLNEEKHENDSTLLPCILPQVYKVNLTCEDLKICVHSKIKQRKIM